MIGALSSSSSSKNTPTAAGRTGTASPAVTVTPSATAASSAATAATTAEHLPGIGATKADWNASHVMDTHGTTVPGCCFNPIPSLSKTAGENVDAYYTVNYAGNRVISYSMRFVPISIDTANARVLAELPGDARTAWTRTLGTCRQSEFVSPTLARLLGPAPVGDTTGGVFVEFDSDEHNGGQSVYDPAEVDTALLSLVSYPKASDGPEC
ncbi:hypothetical protein [Frankia sp. R82]|uniref:hypothetical protein n=1 Tax=Frankia sp. R82 TaxID=2950553 RepID=UPI0020436243|nr:hypothetical protein [Frankia sp. R82]MCM3886136.1 hypothetical protein [Frankia sp. R82]